MYSLCLLRIFIYAGFAGCQPLSAPVRGVVPGMCIVHAKLAAFEPLGIPGAVQMLVSTSETLLLCFGSNMCTTIHVWAFEPNRIVAGRSGHVHRHFAEHGFTQDHSSQDHS